MTGLAQSTTLTRISLFKLQKTEDALIRRVINFAINQGKPYCLQAEFQQADIIIADVLTELPTHHAIEIILEKPSSAAIKPQPRQENQPKRYYLSRPLLVTRTMRLLDQVAAKLPKPNKGEEPINIAPQAKNIKTRALTATPTVSYTAAPKITPPAKTEKTRPVVQPPIKPKINPETLTPKNNPPKPAPQPTPQKNYRYKALVVDDSAAIRKQLELELAETDIFAEFAESGEQAIEKSDKVLYDLVFLDVILPEIDGYAVCRHLRANPKMKKTPIIMLSGKTSPMDEVKGVIAGASTYLTKPIKHTQFQNTLKRVSRWLGHYQAS
ncbi:MAG: response regulator [bacterium]